MSLATNSSLEKWRESSQTTLWKEQTKHLSSFRQTYPDHRNCLPTNFSALPQSSNRVTFVCLSTYSSHISIIPVDYSSELQADNLTPFPPPLGGLGNRSQTGRWFSLLAYRSPFSYSSPVLFPSEYLAIFEQINVLKKKMLA